MTSVERMGKEGGVVDVDTSSVSLNAQFGNLASFFLESCGRVLSKRGS